jgi:hypothetical protein
MPPGDAAERLARLEEQVLGLRDDVGAMMGEIGGAGLGLGRASIRQRLHTVETNEHAAKLARDLLEEAKRERSEARDERRQQFSRWQKLILLGIAVWAALIPTLNLVMTLRGGR